MYIIMNNLHERNQLITFDMLNEVSKYCDNKTKYNLVKTSRYIFSEKQVKKILKNNKPIWWYIKFTQRQILLELLFVFKYVYGKYEEYCLNYIYDGDSTNIII